MKAYARVHSITVQAHQPLSPTLLLPPAPHTRPPSTLCEQVYNICDSIYSVHYLSQALFLQ